MIVYKCDRCGCYYDRNDHYDKARYSIYDQTQPTPRRRVDLCNKCTYALEDFMAMTVQPAPSEKDEDVSELAK